MQAKIKEIEAQALSALQSGLDLKKLEDWKVQYLGKKGELPLLLRKPGKPPEAEPPALGASVNQAKAPLREKAAPPKATLESPDLPARLQNERIDVTLPGRPIEMG